MIEVIEATGSLDGFILFPLKLHAGDPHFVPQLTRDMRAHFSADNPFMRHTRVRYFVARRAGKIEGRIASFINPLHNKVHRDKTGFFGFFDAVEDTEVAGALFDRAAGHLKEEGMTLMRGPMNFSTNEECGFLLEGFDEPPMLMMPYNRPYYNRLAGDCGMEKAKDLYAYIYPVRDRLPEKVLRVAAIAEKRGISVRPFQMKRFEEEMMIFKEVYNSAWENNWGFIPMTDEDILYAGGKLKQIIVPELTFVAEDDGRPVGFMGLVPDFNMVLAKMKGSLNPVSIAKALYYSRRITDLRLMLLGIKKEFRNKAVDALLLREGYYAVRRGGYNRIEFSWILEDNFAVQNIIEMIGGRLYKQYRIYEKSI
ncbi:MAG: hypothetical protein M0Z79_03090 [Nitrospiraceae bacterium]|nr:hypothetical protein [Nitrospiraceae bacterium]